MATAVAVGGALGSAGRWSVGLLWPGWPGTLLVNVTGAFTLAVLLTAAPRARRLRRHPVLVTALGSGLLGGWTTFSAVTVQVVAWLREGEPVAALAYVAVSVLLGAAAVVAGSVCGRRLVAAE